MITFDNPSILLLTVCIVILWWGIGREKVGYIPPNKIVEKYTYFPVGLFILWIFRALFVLCFIGILAGPQRVTIVEDTAHKTLIVLDVSRSMLAEDILPNRIESAKKAVESIITGEKHSVGIIIFAGKPFLSVPFSDDLAGVKNVLGNITPNTILQTLPGLSGTAIGDALLLAKMTLSGSTHNASIILITDGRVNVGIDPILATITEPKVPIFAIGIGSGGSWSLFYTDPMTRAKTPLYDENGDPMVSDVDSVLLRQIAETSGGRYFDAKTAGELREYLQSIARTGTEKGHPKTLTRKEDMTWVLCVGGILSIIISSLIQKRVYSKARIN